MAYVVLDIETTGLNAYYGNQVTVVCARSDNGDCFKGIAAKRLDGEAVLLSEFLDFISKHDDCWLITKNGKAFDIPFIIRRGFKYGLDFEFLLMMQHFDLQELTKKWIGLDDMAKILRVHGKNGNGAQAVELWNTSKFDLLLDYCWNDVMVTENVYLKWHKIGDDVL